VVGNNPFTLYDKFLLKKAMEEFDGSRDVRMVDFGDDAESMLFDSLRACENPAMLQIVGLALETGMRRSEILSLRWAQIKDSHVELKRTKTKARKVALSPAAKAILDSVHKDGEKLFGYTLDGFASNWKRSRKRAGLDGFRFHDLRREFISRILEGLADPSSAAVCYAAGMSDPKHVENAYIKPAEVRKSLKNGIASQRDLMRTIGHETARTTFRYAALRKK
jgi:integrase